MQVSKVVLTSWFTETEKEAADEQRDRPLQICPALQGQQSRQQPAESSVMIRREQGRSHSLPHRCYSHAS